MDVLLEAAKLIDPDIGIYIVGGEPTEELSRLANDNRVVPGRIHFPGFQTKEELALYYRMADVFVLPTREDIWGLVINEAMSYGLPVVTTDQCVAGLTMVRDGVNGRIVKPDVPEELAEAIRDVFLPEHLEKYSQNARAAIRGYTIENMVQAHREILCA